MLFKKKTQIILTLKNLKNVRINLLFILQNRMANNFDEIKILYNLGVCELNCIFVETTHNSKHLCK